VQIHTEDRVVLTVMRDREDYRKMTTVMSYRSWGPWQSLLFSVLVLAMLISLLAEQVIGAVTLSVIAIGTLLLFLTAATRTLRQLPDWAFAPTTFTVSAEGVAVDGPATRRLASWGSLTYAHKLPVAYVFGGPGQPPVVLPRRQLTAEDAAAMDAVLKRYNDRLGDPAAMLSASAQG
jgi:hypothetical protein